MTNPDLASGSTPVFKNSTPNAWNPLRTLLPAIGTAIAAGASFYGLLIGVGWLFWNEDTCSGAGSLACAGLSVAASLALTCIIVPVVAYVLLRIKKIPHAAAITFFTVAATVFCMYVITTNYIYLIPVWLAYFLWLAVYVGGFMFYDWLFNAFKAHRAKKFLLLVVPLNIIWLIDMLGNTINADF